MYLAYRYITINRSWRANTARQVTQGLFIAGDELYANARTLWGKLVLAFLPKEVLTFVRDVILFQGQKVKQEL